MVYSVFSWAEKQQIGAGLGLLPVGVLNGMVKVFARNREFESALCLIFHRMKRARVDRLDADTFAILIRRFARAGLPCPAVRCMELAYSLNLIQSQSSGLNLFEILLDSFCKEGLVLEATEYFNKKRGCYPGWVPSVIVYNSLLAGAFRSRQLELVNWVLGEMKKDKVKRNINTYSTLVEGFCWMSRVDVAIELIEQMNDEGIGPNASVYNSIINALGGMGRFKEALGFLERFLILESGPTLSTYDSLVKSFCKGGDIEGANKILKMMISRGIMPTTATYSYLFRYFSITERTEEGVNLYTKMIESGYNPDRVSCLILVKMLCKQERLDSAMQIKKEMKVRGYDLDFASYTMLVDLLCDTYRLEEALVELKEMIDMGFVPRNSTCRKMLNEMKKHGSMEKGRELSDMVASVPQLATLQNSFGREDYASRVRKRAIMGKAKAMSDTLKIRRNERKLVKKRGNWKSSR